MPALRRNRPSVAPVDIEGTTGTPVHISVVIRSIALKISGFSGDGTLAVALSNAETEIFESARTRISADRTSTGDSPGRIRQFTIARAVCGRAFSACPASRRVATQVVRSSALSYGDFERRSAAARSAGFLARALISAAVSPVERPAIRL